MTENLLDIVCGWLKSHGFDGLYNEGHCTCHVDDLMPCCKPSTLCQAGYQIRCFECSNDCCEANAGGYDYIISGNRTCRNFKEGGSRHD